MRMAYDGEGDLTDCNMGQIFEKSQDVRFSKVQVWLKNY